MCGISIHRLVLVGILAIACGIAAGAATAKPTPAQFGANPDAFERAVLRSQETGSLTSSGYTPQALEALGERWTSYAAYHTSQAGGTRPARFVDARHQTEVPAGALTGAGVDDTGFDWTDAAIGALLGIALVGLGGIAALAMRSSGRVPQS
jgi:hypothetical protein